MEAAIAWLVQSILATLLVDKLDAWIRQVGLADDVEKLKSEIERIETVIGDVRARESRNEILSRSLARLEELLYDAEDAIDEVDYYRLQQQVKGVDDTSRRGTGDAEMPLDDTSSSLGVKKRKKWSKAWENFDVIDEDGQLNPVRARCKHCKTTIKCAAKSGTSGMRNHTKVCKEKPRSNDQPSNSSSTGDTTETAAPIVIDDSAGRKRRREDEESAQITVSNTCIPWDKAELSNMIQKITSQLQNTREKVSEALKLQVSDSASSSNQHLNTAWDQHPRTSGLISRKLYGRVEEKISIKNLILEDKSDCVRVLPIVGTAGVGKTALAQFVYNDPEVESQFQQRIWVWVSRNFDEVRLTREILDFVSKESHEGISSFARLQEILKSHVNSKRLLLVFDDVWDDMNDMQWNKLLAPLMSSHVKGNVILVTTRNMTVAQRLGTLKPVKLDALANDDFWLLFKSCAFGYENDEEHQSISIIGRQIAEKLKGNPLAAVSTGELLRKKLSTDYWTDILMNEDWKSMQLSRGIMSALKLSYDQLPYHLQLCFSYCSIFPDGYQFLGEELVGFWIAQRFVNCNNSTQSLEGIGRCYLIDLVNLGFLQELKREEPYLGSQILYAVCGIMHDFAMMVSRDDYASIDGLQCTKMSRTLRHLSIVTGSAYNKDQHGKFEQNLRNASVKKLRTLVLLGHYDSSFLQLFQDIFQKALGLRVLQMSATSADFLKRGYDEVDGALPQVLSKLYHLQVLNVGSYTDPTTPIGINNLASLRHLVVHKGVYSSIATICTMASFQEPDGFKFQISSDFEMTQLQSTDELVQPWIHVKTLEKVYEAGLRNNELLERLHLSSKESSAELLPMDNSGPNSDPSMEKAGDVFEGLETHRDLRELQIYGDKYSNKFRVLDNKMLAFQNLGSLKLMRIDGCPNLMFFSFRGFRHLVSLKSLEIRRCKKLFSSDVMTDATHEDVTAANCKVFPSLECLSIKSCKITEKWLSILLRHAPYLEKLSLKEILSVEERDSEQDDALTGLVQYGLVRILPSNLITSLKKITIRDCPRLTFNWSEQGYSEFTSLQELLIRESHELLPSLFHKDGHGDQVNRKWLLPTSLDKFEIQNYSKEMLQPCFPSDLTSLTRLVVKSSPDLKFVQLHACTALEELAIESCGSLTALEGLESLGSLRHLTVCYCPSLSPLLINFSRQGYEPYCPLETLHITDPSVLTTSFCERLTSLQRLILLRVALTEEQGRAIVLLKSLQELEFYHYDLLANLPEELLLLPSLKRLKICACRGISRDLKVGIPLPLEILEIGYCSKELADQCMSFPILQTLNFSEL